MPFHWATLRCIGTRTHISSGRDHETLVINKKNQFNVMVPSCFKNVSNKKCFNLHEKLIDGRLGESRVSSLCGI